jgi:hypothetical protein
LRELPLRRVPLAPPVLWAGFGVIYNLSKGQILAESPRKHTGAARGTLTIETKDSHSCARTYQKRAISRGVLLLKTLEMIG